MRPDNLKFPLARRGNLRVAVTLLALLAITCISSAKLLHADTIRIEFTNLSLVYDGTNIFDAGTQNTSRTGDYQDGVPLETMDFFLNNAPVGSLSASATPTPDPIFADLYIAGVPNIPLPTTLPSSVISGGNGIAFGLDLLTSLDVPGWGLALNLDKVTVTYHELAPGFDLVFQGGLADVFAQDLPFGLVADVTKPVTFSFSSTDVAVTANATDVIGFTATGAGTITLQAVPEPATWALACGLGAVGLVAHRWRKIRAAA